MSISSLCTVKDKETQEESLFETIANEKNREMQITEWRNLSREIAKKIYPSEFRNWPILSLLQLEFTMQIRMVMVYGNQGCCGSRALIVTKDENVYSFDYNKNDHMKTGDILQPKKIKELCGKNIKTFACSLYFVLALTEGGEVYSWRFDKNYNSDNKSVVTSTPTRVAGLLNDKYVVDIACGRHHSLALTSDGKVYAWGENKWGQIGSKNLDIMDNLPRLVKHELEGQKVVQIACGSQFNMVVTDTGKLYGWGDNKSSQISVDITYYLTANNKFKFNYVKKHGCVNSDKFYVYPHEITAVSNKMIVKVACGFAHTLVLTDNGKIYAWGNNDNGELGTTNELKPSAPILVDMPELILDIAAHDDVSAAIDNNGTVYVWGYCFGQEIAVPFATGFLRIHDAFALSIKDMHKPLTVFTNNDVEDVLNILESFAFVLEAAFDDPTTSDFTIQVEGQSVHVHKIILKIRSYYFKNKFDRTENNKSMRDTSVEIYSVSNFSYIVYKAFLKYLYTGKIDLPPTKILDLMTLADEYCEIKLKRECNRIIEQAITAANVAFFYNKAIECNVKKLEEFCFQFALRHMKVVILSEEYLKLDMSTKDSFMRRAAEANAFRT